MKSKTDDHGDWLHEVRRDERLDRIWELEKALRDLLMERSHYTQDAAARALRLCVSCHRDVAAVGECSLCQDGRREDYRETA